MDVGSTEIIEEFERPKVGRKSGLFSGPGNGNGGGKRDNGGGNNGDDGSDHKANEQADEFVPNKSRILTAFLLLVVLMTFGGLIAAFIVLATNKAAEWRPFDLPIQVWISTLIILASSFTLHFAKNALDKNDQPLAKKWLLATTVLGASFISSQILVWIILTSRGLYLTGNPFAGLFYFMTGLHAAHVLGGIIALGAVVLRSWRPTLNENEIIRRKTLGQVVGWYWHTMGTLWIVLFVLLGFWR